MSQHVVTYRAAYVSRDIDLCHRHATSEAAGLPLGPVQHGRHRGTCEVCERLAADAPVTDDSE